jgi:hypothetical protein
MDDEDERDDWGDYDRCIECGAVIGKRPFREFGSGEYVCSEFCEKEHEAKEQGE